MTVSEQGHTREEKSALLRCRVLRNLRPPTIDLKSLISLWGADDLRDRIRLCKALLARQEERAAVGARPGPPGPLVWGAVSCKVFVF